MTDKEIIKALECCTQQHKCNECSYLMEHHLVCNYHLYKDTLDLIKRQQAELEMSANYKLLYEDLKDENLETIKCIKQAIEEAKTEAIKEFAERLKEMYSEMYFAYEAKKHHETIDDLVKEMVGE